MTPTTVYGWSSSDSTVPAIRGSDPNRDRHSPSPSIATRAPPEASDAVNTRPASGRLPAKRGKVGRISAAFRMAGSPIRASSVFEIVVYGSIASRDRECSRQARTMGALGVIITRIPVLLPWLGSW